MVTASPARRALAAVSTATAVLVAGAAPASSAPASSAPASSAPAGAVALPGMPVGGPALGSTGVVVHRLAGAPRLPRGISASAWVVADLDTGDVLAARNPHGRYLPASTMKTLTALTLLPRLNPGRLVKASDADASVDGTRVGLVPGFHYRVRELFTAMLVMSGNDAALSLAEAYGGVPRTLAAMNAEARHLNALDTVARTPHGLDAPGQVTSAYDLALIARAGLAMPSFRHYVGVVSANFPAPRHRHYQIWTHDDLLTHYRGAIGVKDGYTVAARASFVGAATRNGHTLVVTLLHAKPYCWHEAARLLDWGFAARARVRPVGELVRPGPLPVAAAVPSPAASAAAAQPIVPTAVHRDSTGGGGLAAPVGAAVGLLIAVAALGGARLRRRHGSAAPTRRR